MTPEIDPHGAYLDAVFAKIDRIRHIDASVLTERYGIDPAVLSPVDGEARSTWAVERLLADADAQRAELREHLEGLVKEYVADGMTFDVAVAKAHQALGDSSVLARQISRSTALDALELDGRWLPILRSHNSILGVCILCLVPLLVFWLPPQARLLFISFWACVSAACGIVIGYADGYSLSPGLRCLAGRIVHNMSAMLSLPTIQCLNPEQRLARQNLRANISRLQSIYGTSENAGRAGRFVWRELFSDCLGVALFALFIFALVRYQSPPHEVQSYVLPGLQMSSLYSLGRTFGVYVGARQRLARRAS